MQGTAFAYQVDHNRIGDIFRRSDLAEISKGRTDQVPKTRNKRLLSIRCIVLILSYNVLEN